MSSSSAPIPFSIRVSSSVKSVHVTGSWDGYTRKLPLSRDKNSSSGKSWCATFRLGVSPGSRYWYYYTLDGHLSATNPSIASVVEPTTGRELNVFDVPEEKKEKKHKSSSSSSSSSKHSSRDKSSSSSSSKADRSAPRLSLDVPKGLPLAISEIKAPKPMTPRSAKHVLQYGDDEMDALAAQFGGTVMIDQEGVMSGIPMDPPASSWYYRSESLSPVDSNSDDDSSRSGSGYSTPASDYGSCTCENYGITRRGDRIKIDCGGRVCGYSEDDASDSDCAVDEAASPVRRRGVVFR